MNKLKIIIEEEKMNPAAECLLSFRPRRWRDSLRSIAIQQ
jgi:hypothetical protein